MQVLNEIAHVSRRKFRYDWSQTVALIDNVVSMVRVTDLTLAIHVQGRRLAEQYRLSVWDGSIVAAALATECDTLYSEDMHDGLVIDGRLRIANPFA